jgi:hypothetical protein
MPDQPPPGVLGTRWCMTPAAERGAPRTVHSVACPLPLDRPAVLWHTAAGWSETQVRARIAATGRWLHACGYCLGPRDADPGRDSDGWRALVAPDDELAFLRAACKGLAAEAEQARAEVARLRAALERARVQNGQMAAAADPAELPRFGMALEDVIYSALAGLPAPGGVS